MSKKWRLTDRTRTLLTLELAIVLPAAALMAFSIWNLKHMQRDRAIEAAIQRDFTYVLKIAEKKSWEKAEELLAPIREEYPNPDDGAPKIKAKLDRILLEHPEMLYAVLYDKKNNVLVSSLQPRLAQNDEFCARMHETFRSMEIWMPMESTDMTEKLRMMAEKGEPPAGFYGTWTGKGDQRRYSSEAYFIPRDVSKDRVSLGMISFDEDYVKNTILPGIMKDVLNSKSNIRRDDVNPPAMMIHSTKDSTPWVASADWDGGKPEVERQFPDVFQNLVWAMKYPGTTIADIGAKFLRYNYAVLAALSLLMIGGIFLTYRNVSREMNLARLKSDFVANVSHELRTPLALIRLYAETLELGRLTAKDKYQEYFRIIREESERLTALINNILDFSRIEAGRKEYEFKETNLPDLVSSTLDSYRFQIEQNGFAFEENISRDIPPVNVDREAIARSLLNLVNNALKYSKDQKFIGVSLYRTNGSV